MNDDELRAALLENQAASNAARDAHSRPAPAVYSPDVGRSAASLGYAPQSEFATLSGNIGSNMQEERRARFLERSSSERPDSGTTYSTGRTDPTMRTSRYSPYQLHATPPQRGSMLYQFIPTNSPQSFALPQLPLSPFYQFPYATAPPSPDHFPFSQYNSPQQAYAQPQNFLTPTPHRYVSTSAMPTVVDNVPENDGLESRRRSSGYSGQSSSFFDSLPTLNPFSHPGYASTAPTNSTTRRSSIISTSSDCSAPLTSIRESRRSSDPSQDRDRSTSTVRRFSAPQAAPTAGNAIAVTDDFPELSSKAGVTPFISKLHSALEIPDVFGDCLRWSANGQSFLIDLANPRLVEKILPHLYSHGSAAAFTRQLNVYPLQRIKDAEYSRIVNELDPSIRAQEDSEWRVYQSPHMTAGDDSKLHLIRPKPSPKRQASKRTPSPGASSR